MTPPDPLTDEDLADIEERANAATPGPWHVRFLDDDWAMNLVAVSTVPDTNRGGRWPDFDAGQIVAATLVQHPGYVSVADDRWDENAYFIANARQDIPRMIAEIHHLRRLLEGDPCP